MAALAGCSGLFDDEETSRLDLTVSSERSEQVTFQADVVGGDGTKYEEASDELQTGVSRAFESWSARRADTP